MKKVLLLITAIGIALANAMAARLAPATGRVVDQQGAPVEYATVVLLKNDTQVAGMATDDKGTFELKAPIGEYTLSIQYLGFEPLKQPVRLQEQRQLGDFVLKNASTQIEGVVVKAQLIRREADRFVVDVANSTAALGKNGIQLLEQAPGVWVTDKEISINGKTGSKIYINDRELRMETEQLLTYLRSLRADEIQKIEVVPLTGADYDASSSGGVIKITLKKRRKDGMEGSASIGGDFSKYRHTYNPSANINYHNGKLDLFASGWGWLGRNDTKTNEQTHYDAGTPQLSAHSDMTSQNYNGGVSIGGVYELNSKHSIGAEFGYRHFQSDGPNDSSTDLISESIATHTDSRYDVRDAGNNYEATFNYIWKIDTLGSTLKVLGDYTNRNSTSANDNFTLTTSPASVIDSTYRDNASAHYNIASATLALEKKFSPRWTLKAGAKYTYNDMRNSALYEYLRGGEWVRNDNQSLELNYSENIAAAYGIVSASLNRWSFVAGLRGEYTHTYGKSGEVAQDYFSLFPNANISYSLSKDGAYSLIAQYARTIARPRFWTLNPQRMQISDYTYQIGNPNLNPSYKQDMSLTLVLKHKYTFTGGVTLQKGQIQETIFSDPDDPNQMYMTWVNYDKTSNYYATVNLPFQPAKWWTLNVGATYIRQSQRITPSSPEMYYNVYFVNTSTSITLPHKFYLDFSYRYQGRMQFGTVSVDPQHRLNAAVKKRFGDKFTASFEVNNLLNQSQVISATGSGFVRRVEVFQAWNNIGYSLSVSYNFKSGKAFKRKSVEASAAEDKSRLQ